MLTPSGADQNQMTDTLHTLNNLEQLQARLQQDLTWLDLPAKKWVIPFEFEGHPVLEVAIIGGGDGRNGSRGRTWLSWD